MVSLKYSSDKATVKVRSEGDDEYACRQSQLLPEKSEVTTGRTTSDRPRGIWPDRPSTTLLNDTEVSSGG